MDPGQIEAATKATVRLALSRGYLTLEELREALVLKQQLAGSGQPANLLSVLASRYLRADHVPELSEYYQRQLAALAASPSGSAPPTPVEAPKIEDKVEAPEELLAKSVEMLRRPPEEDPDEVRTFMRESAKALQLQPADEQIVVPDKVFVALAKKAGYPSKEDLLTCRRIQLERLKAGERITLFEVIQERGVLPERRVKRFRKWAAMVTRQDPAPLEDEADHPSSAPEGPAPAPQKIMLHVSAAELRLPQDVDGEILDHRAEPPAPQAPPKQKKGGLRRAANAVRDSAQLVVRGMARRVQARSGDDPEVAARQMVVFAGAAGVLCAVFGLAIGLLLGGSEPPPEEGPLASATPLDPLEAQRREELARLEKLRAAGDAEWQLLREVQPKDAPSLMAEFARKHPRDPRARHAERFAELIEGERERRDRLRSAYLNALLEKAKGLEEKAPGPAVELYDLVVSLAPRSEEAQKARAARRSVKARILDLEDPAPSPRDPLPRDPRDPKPTPTPRPQADPKRPKRPDDHGTAERVASTWDLWRAVTTAYDAENLPDLERAVAKLLDKIPAGHYAQGAKGLLAFAKDDFERARVELAPLEEDPKLHPEAERLNLWRCERALVRSAFFTKHYELARKVALDLSGDQKTKWLLLIDGPFAAEYPLASKGLTAISPEGNYRVMADVGVTEKELRGIEKSMADPKNAAKVERLQEKLRKGHKILKTLGEVLDKAFSAYNKLLDVKERKAVYPTVYVFKDKAGFAAFGQALGVGATENLLGYYMPYYRILVFYEQTEDVKVGLSKDTVETLLHEAFHQWIHLHIKKTPPWFNEGLAEYFSIGAKITRKRLDFAQVPQRYPSRLSNIQDAIRGANSMTAPWSLKRLLKADQSAFMSSPYTNYGHGWSLVHYFGSSAKGRKILISYFKALAAGASQDEAFEQVFGSLELEVIHEQWRQYTLKLK